MVGFTIPLPFHLLGARESGRSRDVRMIPVCIALLQCFESGHDVSSPKMVSDRLFAPLLQGNLFLAAGKRDMHAEEVRAAISVSPFVTWEVYAWSILYTGVRGVALSDLHLIGIGVCASLRPLMEPSRRLIGPLMESE